MKLHRDIRLRSGNTEFYFKYLEWDSIFFKQNSYILDTVYSRMAPSPKIRKLIDDRFSGCFLTVKIETPSKRGILEFLQSCGFQYIETEIILKYQAVDGQQGFSDPNHPIIEVRDNLNLPYKELGSAFILTRFHADTHIPRKQADLLWVEYIRNHIPSQRDRLFVIKKREEVSGAVIVKINKTNQRGDISFISVRDKFRGKGLGSNLIQHVINNFGHTGLYVGTQASNIGALNFYIKNGFSVIEKSMVVLHRWS